MPVCGISRINAGAFHRLLDGALIDDAAHSTTSAEGCSGEPPFRWHEGTDEPEQR
jgi:hypothetical protein